MDPMLPSEPARDIHQESHQELAVTTTQDAPNRPEAGATTVHDAASTTGRIGDSTDPCTVATISTQQITEENITPGAPIEDRMPPELLATVFASLQTRDLVQLGLVCGRWHATLHSYPHIWADVTFDPPFGSDNALARVLSLSGECPLRLSLGFKKWSPIENAWLLQRNMHRIVRLAVNMGRNVRLAQNLARAVVDALTTPAPRLVYLRLYDPAALFKMLPQGSMFLGGQAPQLTVVKLQCVFSTMMSSRSTFRGVRHALLMPSLGISQTDLQDVVKLFPLITDLGIYYHKWLANQSSDADAASQSPLALPPNLRCFAVMPSAKNADPTRILRSFQTHTAHQIIIAHGSDASTDFDESLLQALLDLPSTYGTYGSTSSTFVARGMTLEASYNGSEGVVDINMLEEDEDMFLLVSPHTPTNPNLLRPTGIFRALRGLGSHSSAHPLAFVHVRSLLVAEMIFDPDVFDFAGGLPRLPQLEHLTVCLMRRRDHLEHSFISCFVSATLDSMNDGESSRALECPKLRTLRIGVEQPTAAPVQLELGSIVAFMRQNLIYSSDKLSDLYFNGIEPLVIAPIHLYTLLSLALDTTFDERRLATPFKRPLILDWD